MRGATLPLPKYSSMAWCSVKETNRGNYTYIPKPMQMLNTAHKFPHVQTVISTQITRLQLVYLYHKYSVILRLPNGIT